MGGKAKQCVYFGAFCLAVCEGVAAQKQLHQLGLRAKPAMSFEEIIAAVPGDA